MILLSNVIKAARYISLDEKLVVEAAKISLPKLQEDLEAEESGGLTSEQIKEIDEVYELKKQILLDAETYAEEQIRHAMTEIEQLKQNALTEIDQWWIERRDQDAQLIDEIKQTAYQKGFEEGTQEAKDQVFANYEEMLSEAEQILKQSYSLKNEIILEAEPFLIELSTAIAEKILNRQLTLAPEWTVEYIQNILARRREKGSIALCVSPKQFQYIQDAREELLLAIDSQAELQIIPDSTVQDHGCVIRSEFGSIDARIDTQLKEIKNVLQAIAHRNEEVEPA